MLQMMVQLLREVLQLIRLQVVPPVVVTIVGGAAIEAVEAEGIEEESEVLGLALAMLMLVLVGHVVLLFLPRNPVNDGKGTAKPVVVLPRLAALQRQLPPRTTRTSLVLLWMRRSSVYNQTDMPRCYAAIGCGGWSQCRKQIHGRKGRKEMDKAFLYYMANLWVHSRAVFSYFPRSSL
jgi:hypothetical protein